MNRQILKFNIFIAIAFISILFLHKSYYSSNLETEGTYAFDNYNLEELMPTQVTPIENIDTEVAETYKTILPTINELAERFIENILNNDIIDKENLDKLLSGLEFDKTKSFANDLLNRSKNLGKFNNFSDTQVIFSDGKYETVLVLNFEKGNLTVNLSHSKSLPYLIFATSKNLNIEDYLLDRSDMSSVFTDYYISNGINLNQVSALRGFSKNLKLFLIVAILLTALYNIYLACNKKNNKTKNFEQKQIAPYSDTHMTAVITAALNAYINDKNENKFSNGIHVKTIKKTNWKKLD